MIAAADISIEGSAPTDRPRIRLDNVGISFTRPGQAPLQICRDLSLEVLPGRIHVIAGRSGSGKTSVLNVAAGLVSPSRGTVFWDGVDIAGWDDDHITDTRRDMIGVLTQGAELIDGLSAAENVLIPAVPGGRSRELRARALDLLAELGLSARAKHRPRALSGGERLRTALARAMLLRPPVIIADEPTASLDRQWADAVIECLRGLAADGTALLLASHDEHLIASAHSSTPLE